MIQVVKDILRKIEQTVSHYNMLEHGNRVLVAVSGGPDSVVLLDVLDRLKEVFSLELMVAHFDHSLRPQDDEHETRFVASLAASKNLPFMTQKALSSPAKSGKSLEEEARDWRYAFLDHAKNAHGAHKIALGHTLDDQAETVIMRLLRGSGPTGLSGIPPVRNHHIIRPLIDISRREILDYIARRDLRYITDPSNVEKQHLRNRIRLDLLPELKTYQPRIVEILGQTAGIMRDETQWMETEAERWIAEFVEVIETEKYLVPLKAFGVLAAALQNQVVRQIIKRVQGGLRRISLRHIDAIKSLLEGRPQATLNLPSGVLVEKSYETLLFTKNRDTLEDRENNGFHHILEGLGVFNLEPVSCTVTIEEIKAEEVSPKDSPSPWVACFDADRIEYPLIVRSFLPGDRFVPLGMTGHKKVKDFFMDRKIPFNIRKNLPLLCQGKNPIWVCGLRIDNRFKVHSETKKVVQISLSFPTETLNVFCISHPSG
ncbi:MAG: tRNA lysidine(34) synthetase TilS [Desulfobacteraceae bacterium 4572_87]|nr:MAG: tRNA lysidine(34) synthetase TilS [Desulfobacteraceae bacterium 4572_87]